jgi:hypothetical protein
VNVFVGDGRVAVVRLRRDECLFVQVHLLSLVVARISKGDVMVKVLYPAQVLFEVGIVHQIEGWVGQLSRMG